MNSTTLVSTLSKSRVVAASRTNARHILTAPSRSTSSSSASSTTSWSRQQQRRGNATMFTTSEPARMSSGSRKTMLYVWGAGASLLLAQAISELK
ncbi:hypothetical protein HK102_001248 [Quaeritorhiza haematococci]|nr:hypothetical protein HK102_001248 [Quaeritorhiza haematococci]